METSWYIPDKNILKNFKFEEQSHGLQLSKKNWNKITAHLDRNRLLVEAQIDAEERKRAMREASRALMNNWSKSIEDKAKHKEIQRRYRLKEQYKLNHYMHLTKKQQKERESYIIQTKDAMKIRTSYPVSLSNALLLGEVMYARSKQEELNKTMKMIHVRKEKLYAEQLKLAAEKEKLQNAKYLEAKRQQQLQYAQELTETIAKKYIEEQDGANMQRKIELENIEVATNRNHIADRYKVKKVRQNQQKLKFDLEDQMNSKKKGLEKMKYEVEQLNKANDIFKEAKDQVAETMKQKHQKRLIEKAIVADDMWKVLDEEFKKKLQIENELYKKCYSEKIAMMDNIEQKKVDRQMQLQESRKGNCFVMFPELTRVAKGMEMETKNTHKPELHKKRQEPLKKKLPSFNEQVDLGQKLMYTEVQLKRFEESDKEFYQDAEELLKFSKKHNRITYPIKKAITKYKTEVQQKPTK